MPCRYTSIQSGAPEQGPAVRLSSQSALSSNTAHTSRRFVVSEDGSNLAGTGFLWKVQALGREVPGAIHWSPDPSRIDRLLHHEPQGDRRILSIGTLIQDRSSVAALPADLSGQAIAHCAIVRRSFSLFPSIRSADVCCLEISAWPLIMAELHPSAEVIVYNVYPHSEAFLPPSVDVRTVSRAPASHLSCSAQEHLHGTGPTARRAAVVRPLQPRAKSLLADAQPQPRRLL